MFCSGCGCAIAPGQGFCPQCGRPAAAPVAAMPGLAFQVENYAGKVRALSVVWFIYAGIVILKGIVGMAFANAFLGGHMGPWIHGPWMRGPLPPEWLGPGVLHLMWVSIVIRVGLALIAGWGLMERTQWGRIVAIVAAILALIHIPFGTAVGIWSLVILLGYRNSSLYEQL